MNDLFHFGSAAKALDADDRYGSDGEMKKTQYIMQVLGFPGHPDTLKLLLTAAEKGIEVETAVIDMSTNQQDSEDYRAISPLGVVPALKEADYICVGENGTSVFVEGRGLGRFLAPRNAAVLADQNYWMDIGRTEVQPHIETLVHELVVGEMADPSYTADAAKVDAARAALATPFDALDAKINSEYIVGEFCYVDIHWTAYCHLLTVIGEAEFLNSRPSVKAWFEKIKVHKSYSGQDIMAYDFMPSLEDIKAKKLADIECGEF